MSVPREPVVPASLAVAVGRGAEAAEGLTLLLLTVREDGFPHVAMLSAGEVVARDARRLAIALWPSSTAATALARTGRATMAAVLDGVGWSLRLEAREAAAVETPLSGRLRRFEATVVAATADEAPYAVLGSGVTFRLTDPHPTLRRWAQVRAALEAAEAS